MNAQEWISAYAERLGAEPPDSGQVKAILDLAAVAAHSSERIAAPVACWLSAAAGRSLEDSLELARGLSPEGAAEKGSQ